MIKLPLSQLAQYLGLSKPSQHVLLQGISTDSRHTCPGELFIALQGELFDGHHFIAQAEQKGAAALLVSKPVHSSLPLLQVADTTIALGQIAKYWRQTHHHCPLVAITGSHGKTTVKNMLAAILNHAAPLAVLWPQKSFNNHIGVPLTLLQLTGEHRYAVIEMGMSHFGELSYLTQLAKPTVAVITNAHPCHLEGVGDIAGVARAKAEIFEGLEPNGTMVLNADDAFFDFWQQRQKATQRLMTFGINAAADIRAEHITLNLEHVKFTLQTPSGSVPVTLAIPGHHNVYNAIAAAAAAYSLDIPLTHIAEGLAASLAEGGRLQKHVHASGAQIIDDSYNAAPASLAAALAHLNLYPGNKILVLGDLGELGEHAVSLHQQFAANIREAGVACLYTFGTLSQHTSEAFGAGAKHYTDVAKLAQDLLKQLKPETTVLIKGSRVMKMESVLSHLNQTTSEVGTYS